MASATRKSLEHRRLHKAVGELLDLSLNLDRRASKILGEGWTAARYCADGTPGSEVLQLTVRIGSRLPGRFEP